MASRPGLLRRIGNRVNRSRPGRALRKRVARAMFGAMGFQGAEMSRYLKQWMPSWFNVNQMLANDLPALRERSRDLDRNNPVARAINDTMADHVIGSGLRLHCKIDRKTLGLTDEQAEEWEDLAERRWRMWADSKEADCARGMTFGQIQKLAYRSTQVDGDTLALLPEVERPGSEFSLRVQMVEAHLLQTPGFDGFDDKVRMGIETDEFGAPKVYHFAKYKSGGYLDGTIEVKAFGEKTGRQNVIHFFNRTRPGQLRGVPLVSTVLGKIKNLDRYDEAELVAAMVSSQFTVFVKSNSADDETPPIPGGSSEDDNDHDDDGRDYTMGAGAINFLDPDQEVQFANPSRPNSQYAPFINAQIRDIGMGVRIPFEILVQQFNSSYSASRASRVDFYNNRVRPERKAFSESFNQPVYEEWLTNEVLAGRIKAPGFLSNPAIRRAYCQASWIGSPMGSIDEIKDVTASKMRMEARLTTLSQETLGLTGEDWKSNADKRNFEEEYTGETLSDRTESSTSAA